MQLEEFKILTVTHKRTNLKEIGNFVVKAEDQQSLRQHLHGRCIMRSDELLRQHVFFLRDATESQSLSRQPRMYQGNALIRLVRF